MGGNKLCILDLPLGQAYVKCNTKLVKKILTKYDFLDTHQKYRIKNGDKFSLDLLKKIIKTLKLNPLEVEKNLELITSNKATNRGIKNPKLFINLKNKELARFISGILGDGSLSKNLLTSYHNQDISLIKLMLVSAIKIFGGIDEKVYYAKDKTYHLNFPKIIGRYLLYMGLKPSYKPETNQKLPPFIFEMDKNGKALFLRQFFNDEGNVRLKDRRLQIKQTIKIQNSDKNTLRANIEKYAPNVLKDIKILLLELGIKSKISLGCYRGDKSDWELSSYGKENLEMFRDKINFDTYKKSRLLDFCLESYKYPSAPRNGMFDFALEHAKKVQEKHNFITKALLMKECKRSYKIVTLYIIDLRKKGLIKTTEKPRDKLGHSLPHVYTLI